MKQKWNLQDIQPSRPRKRTRPQPTTRSQPTDTQESTTSHTDDNDTVIVQNGTKKKRWYKLFLIIGLLVFIGGILFVSYAMRGAELTVTPQTREVTINSIIEATPTPAGDTLTYEILTIQKEGERQVNANGTEEVESLAEGTIIIYNEQSPEPVRLVTNTRFESENGLIFRINDPAIVPGYSTNENGDRVPGTITAEVFADDVGEEYNVPPSSFTIPGFAGEPEFETVYAESVESFSGGFVGEQFIISDEDFNTATQALRTELRNSLLDQLQDEQPAGFIAFDGAVTFTYETLPSVAYGDDLAAIKEIATLRIPLFAESDFASFIADATVPGYEGGPVRIDDYSTLTFTYEDNDTSATDITTLDSLEFKLVGRPFLIWEYDTNKLKTDLLTAHKSALPQVLDAYPAILKAEAVIRPFWKNTFPMNLDDLTVTEVIDR